MMITPARLIRLRLAVATVSALLFAPAVSAEVVIEWVTVDDPGNTHDTQPQGWFGTVANTYRIGKYEVTNAQYAEFLNAVATTDTNALYSTNMGSTSTGGITRSGSPGSYSYSVIVGRADMPVTWVSFWDATRFANWLHNGQTTGAQDATTTEDGAYTLTPAAIAANSVTRNGGATAFVTSEDEWYKAAYYKGGDASAGYWDYPAGTDTPTTCTVPGAAANTANCLPAIGNQTAVGSYTGSTSPFGTFDQGGNVREWNEASISSDRSVRGGSFSSDWSHLAASERIGLLPTDEDGTMGFRVASAVPASAVPSMAPLGIGLLTSIIGLVSWQKLRRSS